MRSEGARVTGVTLAEGGDVACGVVVNTAGASGAPEICASLGVELPIESRKRFTFVFECREPIRPTPLTITEFGVAFRSEGKGFISNVSPPPERDPVTKDTEIDYDLFDELIWPVLASRVPAFEAIKLTGAWCCHYDYNTLDENLIIGRTPAYENYYLAAGFSGHGLQQSPAVGRALAELITFGEYRAIDLARFGYERVPAGEAIRRDELLLRGASAYHVWEMYRVPERMRDGVAHFQKRSRGRAARSGMRSRRPGGDGIATHVP